MRKSTFVVPSLTVVALLLVFSIPVRSQQYLDFKTLVDVTLLVWQGDNQIQITTDARSLVLSGFLDSEKMLRDRFGKQELDSSQQAALLRSLVDHYLYEVRDIKAAKTTQHTSYTRVNMIAAEDVKAFTVGSFIILLAGLFERPIGHLTVISKPDDGANISIDGQEKGFTNKTFVVSPGNHVISVTRKEKNLDCSGSVYIQRRKTEYFTCQ